MPPGGGIGNRPKVIIIIIIIIIIIVIIINIINIIIIIVIIINDLARVYPTPGVVFLSANILPGTDILNLRHQYVKGGGRGALNEKKFGFESIRIYL